MELVIEEHEYVEPQLKLGVLHDMYNHAKGPIWLKVEGNV